MMKKLFVLAAAVGFAAPATAQVSDSDGAAVSLSVVAGISISNTSGIAFGNVPVDAGTVTMNPQTGVVTIGTFTRNGTAGGFTVGGVAAGTFSISAPAVNLTGPGDPISFTPDVFGGPTNVAASSASVTSGTLSGTGAYYLFVGGSLSVPSGQTVGAYSGTATVTVQYTAF